MKREFSRNTFRALSIITGCFLAGSFYSPLVHAELSVGALAGLADYTSQVRGDTIRGYGGPGGYYQYPADFNSKDFAGGLFARYIYPVYPCFGFGVETGYVYLNQDTTRLRADDLLPSPVDVENFTTKSQGLILLNFIARWKPAPNISFNFFGGPAWLNTQYIDNDFYDHAVSKAPSTYQLTADLGVEGDWDFAPDWSVGARYDYILNTDKRTIATTGSFGDRLYFNEVAKSGSTIVSATLRYLIPGT